MDGNILLSRYFLSSSVCPTPLQVDSVMIASHGKPYKAVRPFANASGKDIFRIFAIMNENSAIPATPMMMRMIIGPMICFSISGVQSLSPSNTYIISANIVIWKEFARFSKLESKKPMVVKITPNINAQIAPLMVPMIGNWI